MESLVPNSEGYDKLGLWVLEKGQSLFTSQINEQNEMLKDENKYK
jgi:hypothetical protein